MTTPQTGQLLDGRYCILRLLSEGGFGQTYVAEDTRLPGTALCVVKYLKPATGSLDLLNHTRRLFNTEAETLQILGKHEHIPQLLAFFEEDGDFFLVQELIDGHTLTKELIPGKPWSDAAVCQLLWEVLTVLEFVHAHGVIHRDIKPDNVIRRHADNKLLVVDFGTVKQVRNSAQPNMHISATIAVGTPGYMPTEQSHGKPRPNSDIYALGIIGVQALTGILPTQLPENPKTGELVWQPSAKGDKRLTAILRQMVRYHFKDRYQSVSDVLTDLTPLMNRYGVGAHAQTRFTTEGIAQWWTKLASRVTPQPKTRLLGEKSALSLQPAQTVLSPSARPVTPTQALSDVPANGVSAHAVNDAAVSPTGLSADLSADLASDTPAMTTVSELPGGALAAETSLSLLDADLTASASDPILQESNTAEVQLLSNGPGLSPPTIMSVSQATDDGVSRSPAVDKPDTAGEADPIHFPQEAPGFLTVEPSVDAAMTDIPPAAADPFSYQQANPAEPADDFTPEALSSTPLPLSHPSHPSPGPRGWQIRPQWLLGIGVVGAIATGGALWAAQWYQAHSREQQAIAQIEALATDRAYDSCIQQAQTFESNTARLNTLARTLLGQCLVAQATNLVKENRFLDAITSINDVPNDTEASGIAKTVMQTIFTAATERYRQGKVSEANAIATAMITDATLGARAKQQLEDWAIEQTHNQTTLAAAEQALAAGRWEEAIKAAERLTLLGQPFPTDSDYWKQRVEPIVTKAQRGIAIAQQRQAQPASNSRANQPTRQQPTRPSGNTRPRPPRNPSGGQPPGGGFKFNPL